MLVRAACAGYVALSESLSFVISCICTKIARTTNKKKCNPLRSNEPRLQFGPSSAARRQLRPPQSAYVTLGGAAKARKRVEETALQISTSFLLP